MSDQEDDQPRRSGRQRRQPQAYGNSPSKNNRMAVDDEGELSVALSPGNAETIAEGRLW